MTDQGIAYQNKDIVSKYFADHLPGKSLSIYGIDIPEVEEALPTNLPLVEANELRMDYVFRLKDQSIAIIDYESDYSVDDKLKYIGYIYRVARRYFQEQKRKLVIRMIVIYTGDIERRQISETFDLGSLHLNVEAAFLSELNAAGIRERLKRKILSGERLTDEELMEFVILPMSSKGREAKNAAIRENLDLAEKMPDDDERVFLLSGMLVIANRIIEADSVQRIGRMIRMTKLGQLWEEERQQALAEAAQARAAAAEAEAKAAKAEAEAAKAEAEATEARAEATEARAEATEARVKVAKAEAEATEARAEAAQAEAKAAEARAKAGVETERRMAKAMLTDGLSPETVLQYSMYLSKRDILDLAEVI